MYMDKEQSNIKYSNILIKKNMIMITMTKMKNILMLRVKVVNQKVNQRKNQTVNQKEIKRSQRCDK